MSKNNFKYMLSLTACLCLTACGSGSTSAPTTTSVATTAAVAPTTTSGAPSFTPNVFEPRENFVDQCEAPRSGVDPDGFRFPDTAGSELIEKFWLRSWSEETYLWNDEIIDRNPNNFQSRESYFDVLVTTELSETGSGREKDDFHFDEDTEDFFERRNSVATSGYGARFVFISNTVPRDVRVLYTEPNSPASAVQNGSVNFPRGTQILSIDGIDPCHGRREPQFHCS